MLLQGGQDTLASLDAWISKAQGMLDGLDPDRLDKWISSMRAYADALQKRDAIRLRVSALGDERNAQGTRIRSALDILTGQAAMTSGEPATLNYLAGIFSQGAANAYAPPTVKTAAWVLQAKYTPQGLRASADRLLAPGVLRDYLSDTYTEALVGAKQSLYELDGPIRAGFAALTGESPGFGMRLDTLPSEASFFPTSPESDETNRGLLKRLDNLYRGLADLPGAIVLQEGAQNAYRKAVKDYYTQMILLDVAACDKADKLLDATKPDEAQKTLDAVVGQYPSYPSLPEGVWIDEGVKPENIVGVADALAADQKRKTDLAIRISQMKRTVGDEGSIAAIRDLYVKFKQAYQAKDDARVMSFIGDRWEAGDGTTLADLQENLRNAFGMFDSISYDLQNLRIRRQADGDFVVTYDVAIVSRIFKDNLTHQEKSSVSEMVSVGASGKAKIVRTLTGNYWLIQ